MPTRDAHALREAIGRTLAQRSGDLPDSAATARALSATWTQMTEQLAPVIGSRGVDILLRRAIHQTAGVYPWFATDQSAGTNALSWLAACVARQDSTAAAEASRALLGSFTESLTTLIGHSLTQRLLAPVWGSAASPSKQELAP